MRGPASFGLDADQPFPAGVRVEIAPDVRRPHATVLFGGAPPRMLRLTPQGAALLGALGSAPVRQGASARLARRLTDAGIAHARPDRPEAPPDVTVVVPVRDRPAELAACLGALGGRHPVTVVDDGSVDPFAVAALCRRHGASLVRREVPGGPAAARNAGLRAVGSELVAFVDSDCVATPEVIESLAAHFVDPLVVGVAPRIVASDPGAGASLLDLGARPASVHPRSAVPYVPAAAVVFRRGALGDGYDERMRYGEDVDLVWRLVEAGWRIRYDPAVEVHHQDPRGVLARCRRRFSYGTSVGSLERAHPHAVDHLVIGAAPALALGGVLAGVPVVSVGAWAVAATRLSLRLRSLGVRPRFALWLSATQMLHAWIALGRWITTFGVPVLAAGALARRALAGDHWRRGRPGARGGRRGRRVAVAAAASALVAGRAAANGPQRRVVADALAGEVAYGLGVVAGCVRAGVVGPLVPHIGRRPSLAGETGAPRAAVVDGPGSPPG